MSRRDAKTLPTAADPTHEIQCSRLQIPHTPIQHKSGAQQHRRSSVTRSLQFLPRNDGTQEG